ncbi:hypothetical protein HYX06_00700 [Candidatus Woesearchaeota archaeon]|nr:hypothetical protein [Candidatus Woesearchaeota archaeon]
MAQEKMIRGAGRTCIFSHNSHLSQCVLGGKHPSLPCYWMLNLYKKLSVEKWEAKEARDFRVEMLVLGPEFQNKMALELGRDFQNWENWELELVEEKRHEN